MSKADLELTPKEIVAELDRYVIGQQEAKRAVAIALRNRWRRKHVAPEIDFCSLLIAQWLLPRFCWCKLWSASS